jgi:hypothetical protein
MYLESSIAEYTRALANSEQSILDIEVILSTLRDEVDTCAKSLNEWNGFLMKERVDIQGMGSIPRYVTEKFAQIKEDTSRSRFELISYTRRLLKLAPTNEDCKQFLNTLLGVPAPEPQTKPKPKPQPKPQLKPQPKPQEEPQGEDQKKAEEEAKKKTEEEAQKKAEEEEAKKKTEEEAQGNGQQKR